MLKSIESGTGGSTAAAGNTGSTTLTAAQSGVPAHGHGMTQPAYTIKINGSVQRVSGINTAAGSGTSGWMMGAYASGYTVDAVRTTNAGVNNNTAANASSGHTHTAGMPQNIGVYVWKRTA